MKFLLSLALLAMFLVAPAQSNNAKSAFERKDVTALKAMAEAGDPIAQTLLGSMYNSGEGVVKDYAIANSWFRKAADQGNREAQFSLGIMYYHGRGVTQDYATAVSWLRKAADQGYATAQNNIGYMYSQGVGVPQDKAIAVSWYRKAADQWDREAQHNLGNMYADGAGVTQDYAAAFSWYRKAADQGYAAAQFQVGNMYRRGAGVEKNNEEANRWYRLSADNGSSHGQKLVGDMYRYREASTTDRSAREWAQIEAMRWYRMAADQGNSDAQIAIGEMYLFGSGGVAKDYAIALSWAQKAADKGNWDAQRLIAAIASNRREVVEAARKANAERDSKVVLSFNYRGRTIKYEKRYRTGVVNTCLDLIIKKYNAKKIEIWNKPFRAGWGKFSFENGFLQQQYIAWLQNGNGESVFCAHKNGLVWGIGEDILE